jgi:hypothetical protein
LSISEAPPPPPPNAESNRSSARVLVTAAAAARLTRSEDHQTVAASAESPPAPAATPTESRARRGFKLDGTRALNARQSASSGKHVAPLWCKVDPLLFKGSTKTVSNDALCENAVSSFV